MLRMKKHTLSDQNIFNEQAFDYQSAVFKGLKISGKKTNICSKYKKNCVMDINKYDKYIWHNPIVNVCGLVGVLLFLRKIAYCLGGGFELLLSTSLRHSKKTKGRQLTHSHWQLDRVISCVIFIYIHYIILFVFNIYIYITFLTHWRLQTGGRKLVV